MTHVLLLQYQLMEDCHPPRTPRLIFCKREPVINFIHSHELHPILSMRVSWTDHKIVKTIPNLVATKNKRGGFVLWLEFAPVVVLVTEVGMAGENL